MNQPPNASSIRINPLPGVAWSCMSASFTQRSPRDRYIIRIPTSCEILNGAFEVIRLRHIPASFRAVSGNTMLRCLVSTSRWNWLSDCLFMSFGPSKHVQGLGSCTDGHCHERQNLCNTGKGKPCPSGPRCLLVVLGRDSDRPNQHHKDSHCA